MNIKVTVEKYRMFIGWNPWGNKEMTATDAADAKSQASEFANSIDCLPRETQWIDWSTEHILSDDGPLCDNEGRPAENHRIRIHVL